MESWFSSASAWALVWAYAILFAASVFLCRLYRTLKLNESRLGDLIDHLDHSIIWDADPETLEFKFVAERTRALLGYPPELWMERGREIWRTLVPPEDQEKLFRIFSQARSIPKMNDARCEHRMRTADGRVRWFLTGVHLRTKRNGNIPEFYGISVDITPIKEAEESAQENRRQLQAILDNSPAVIYVKNMDGKFTLVNKKFERIFNVNRESAIGRSDADLFPKAVAETLRNNDQKVIQSLSPIEAEEEVPQADGTHTYISAKFPLLTKEGTPDGICGISTDITVQKRAVEKLAGAIQMREEVLAIVSHDLRNPLGAILMNAALIERRAPKRGFGIFARTHAEKIKTAGLRMNTLIEDLVNLSKMDAGHFTLQRISYCGIGLVEEAISQTQLLATEKRIRIETEIKDHDFSVNCDHDQLLRVFSNLIGNAIKFTPEDGLIRVIVSRTPSGDIQFSVADTGPGIAEHHLTHVFDRYWQAARTAHKGTGLGLSIAKGIIEAHGGRIWVESRFGSGATFHFVLPSAAPSAKAEEVA